MNPNVIVWLDLETTGLNPHENVILEVGIIITDWDLHELDRKNWIISQPEESLNSMDPYVQAMHTQNKLLSEIRTLGKSQKEVEMAIKDFLMPYEVPKTRFIMGGNSINFDKTFIQIHLPSLSNLFSHQIIDGTSFILLFNVWKPDLPIHLPVCPHRALGDLELCLARMRHYRQWIKETDKNIEESNRKRKCSKVNE